MLEPKMPPKKTKEHDMFGVPPEHREGLLRAHAQVLAGQTVPVEEVEKEMQWAKDDE